MWSQSWSEIFDILEPFPGKSAIDITPTLQEQVGIGYSSYMEPLIPTIRSDPA